MEKQGRSLTPKQEAFCREYTLGGKTQRQAYITAYGRGNKTDKSIDELASRLLQNVKVKSRCAEMKATLAEAAIWEKAEMIRDLKRIADECRTATIKTASKTGKPVASIDSRARSVAVNAIKTAGEFLGYKAADKVELGAVGTSDIRISFVDKTKRSAGEEKDPKIVGDYTEPIGVKDK